MVNNSFTPEKLMQDLILMYAHLNDDNQKAEEVYNKIIAKEPR